MEDVGDYYSVFRGQWDYEYEYEYGGTTGDQCVPHQQGDQL